MTTVEAQSCGTKAIVYKNTACEEIVKKFGGSAVDQNVDAIYNAVTSHFAGGVYKIICYPQIGNVCELVELYSNADVFVNLTYEDNFPTVNLEALACGTPVITYQTGGSPEAIDNGCGFVVEQGNLNKIIEAIKSSKKEIQNCVNRAYFFDRRESRLEFLNLYIGK